MITEYLSSVPLWIILVAIALFIVGFKVAKMILWGLAIVLFIVAIYFGFF